MPGSIVEFTNKTENSHFEGVFDISPADLLKHQSSVLVVDVRQPEEYTGELGHIADSRLIVLNTLPQHLAELPKDQSIVFVCLLGGRSSQATAYARSQGFEHVYNMTGGMKLWNQLNLPTER